MSEEKKEIKKYYMNPEIFDGIHDVVLNKEEGYTALVEESEYKKLAGENKALKHELKKLAELVDKKNAEIDQFSDETKTVPASLFDETKARLEMCRKKLKKLGAWQGE